MWPFDRHHDSQEEEKEELQKLIDTFRKLRDNANDVINQLDGMNTIKLNGIEIPQNLLSRLESSLGRLEIDWNFVMRIVRRIKTAEDKERERRIEETPTVEVKISRYIGKGDIYIGSKPKSSNPVLIECDGVLKNHCIVKVLSLPSGNNGYKLRVTAGGFLHIPSLNITLSPKEWKDIYSGNSVSILLYEDLRHIQRKMPPLATINLKT